MFKQKTNRRMLARFAVAALIASSFAISSATTGSAAPGGGNIPDTGLPAVPVDASALVSTRTQPLLAGVEGMNLTNDSFPNTQIRVAAFAEIDDVVYVGGKFTSVRVAATGVQTAQPFLAAFDRDTGAWIDSFRPVVDGNVWDLKATPDGRLIVAGQFTNINGVTNTTGVAMIDTTGAVDPTWRVDLVLTGSSRRALARTLDIEGDKVYIGGNFTRITGTDGITKNAGQLARVALSSGNVDGAFLPNIDGVVFDVDATSDRVYVVGNFLNINGNFSIGMGALQPANGQLVPGLKPAVRTYTRNTRNSYQQAILSLGDEIWQTGAQHNTHVYRKSDYDLLRGFVSMPWGDGQALAHLNGIVYKGSHANGDTLEYADTVDFPGVSGWTTRKPVRWMGAWDATFGGSHDHLTWYPEIGTSHGEGGWELFADSTDCLWAGGDFNRGSYDGNVARYVGGFARFCATDTTPPGEPINPTAKVVGNGVNLAWTGSTDDRGGEVRYEILKNDTVLASYISIDTFRDDAGTATDRYFVRAMDYTGNRSATTQVFTAAENDTTRPTTPSDLVGTIRPDGDIDLTWTASTDNIAVTEYIVFRNGVEITRSTDPSALATDPEIGDNWYQVRAIDAAGNESFKTPSTKITVVGPDTTKPTTPADLAGTIGATGDVTLTWTASTDDVGVVEYDVLRNGVLIDTVSAATVTVISPPAGNNFFQVQARDAAGNESFKTSPVEIVITTGDATNPSTPTDLAGTQLANDDVELTWTASTDNVAVTEYLVFRNGVEIDTVSGPSATITAPPTGTNYFQVRALDAAGNQSFKTAPLAFEVVGPDITKPTTPTDLAAGPYGRRPPPPPAPRLTRRVCLRWPVPPTVPAARDASH